MRHERRNVHRTNRSSYLLSSLRMCRDLRSMEHSCRSRCHTESRRNTESTCRSWGMLLDTLCRKRLLSVYRLQLQLLDLLPDLLALRRRRDHFSIVGNHIDRLGQNCLREPATRKKAIRISKTTRIASGTLTFYGYVGMTILDSRSEMPAPLYVFR